MIWSDVILFLQEVRTKMRKDGYYERSAILFVGTRIVAYMRLSKVSAGALGHTNTTDSALDTVSDPGMLVSSM